MSAAPLRHFLDLSEYSGEELRRILDASAAFKAQRRKGEPPRERPLAGKMLAMVFDKPSTRTRVSFDVAMRELGGETIMLTGQEMQLGRGETIGDTARVLSRYVSAIMIRILDHAMMLDMAQNATVPVINGLTKLTHPCQIMADILTFEEHRGPIQGRTIAWVGDANNVLASWIQAAARFDFRLNVATPPELDPRSEVLTWAKETGSNVALTRDPYRGGGGRRCSRHRLLGLDGRRGRGSAAQPPQALSGQRQADDGRGPGRDFHALPAGPPWRRSDGRDHGRPAIGRLRRSREPAPRAEGILAWCLGALPG